MKTRTCDSSDVPVPDPNIKLHNPEAAYGRKNERTD